MKRFIFVTTKIEGIHKYVDAPDAVSYLRNDHRHLFGIKAQIEVFHNDRELEFIMVKQDIEKWLKDAKINSCETLAEELHGYLVQKYQLARKRSIVIIVDEDGENGAIVGDV